MKCNSCGTQVGFLNLKDGMCKKCYEQVLDGDVDIQSNGSEIKVSNTVNSNAIHTLKGFAKLVLVVGIFVSLVIFIASLVTEAFYFIFYAIGLFIVTLVQWAFIKVFAEMAEDIREIRNSKS